MLVSEAGRERVTEQQSRNTFKNLNFMGILMKQTNSAVTMLLSAFDSLYRKAYVKGIAAAVALTAGLTAGAQAADNAFYDASGENLDAVTINKEVTMGDKAAFADDVTVVNGGSIVSVEGVSKDNLYITGTLELQAGSKINITGDAGGKGIWGSTREDKVDATSALKATGAEITLKSSQIEMANVSLTDTKVTLSSNIGILAGKPRWAQNTMILAEGSAEDGTGIMTIAGNSTIDMGEGSQLTAAVFNLNDGTITMKGTGDLATKGNDKSSYIRTYVNGGKNPEVNGIANLNGGRIEVAEGKNGVINSARINLNGTTIVNNGTLDLGTWTKDATPDAGETDIESTGGSITNNGTFKVTGTADFSDVTITNNKDINVSGDLTVDTVSGLYGKEFAGEDSTKTYSKLTVSGNLTVNDADSFDITNEHFDNLTAGTLEARLSTVTIDKDYAQDFDTLTVANLVAKKDGANDFEISAGSTVTILNGMTVQAASQSTRDAGFEDISVKGTVNLGLENETGGQINLNYKVSETGALKAVAGNWSVGDVTLTAGNAVTKALEVVDGASLTTESLTVTKGTAAVSEGTLTIGELTVTATDGKVTVGDASDAAEANLQINGIGKDGVKGSVTVENLGSVTLSDAATKDILDSDGDIDSGKWVASNVNLKAGSQLKVALTGDKTADQVGDLVAALAGTNDGLVDLGAVNITDLDKNKDGVITSTEMDTLSNVTTSSLRDKTFVVESGETVSGGAWNGIASEDATAQITGTTIVTSKNGHFVWQANDVSDSDFSVKQDAAISLDGSNVVLTLEGTGTVASVTGAGSDDILNLKGGAIDAGTLSTLAEVNVLEDAAVSAKGIDVTDLDVDGSLTVLSGDDKKPATVQVTNLDLGGRMDVDQLSFADNGSANVEGFLKADSIKFNATNAATMSVTGSVFADTIDVSAGTNGLNLTVGNATSSGEVEVNTLDVSGGSLKVDPDFDQRAAAVAIKGFDAEGDLGHGITIGGNLLVGRNAMVGVGVDLTTLRSVMGRYTNSIGALSEDNVGAALYLNDTYDVATGDNVVVDSTKFDATLVPGSQRFALGDNSALIISSELTDYLADNDGVYAITYADDITTPSSAVSFGDNSQIIFESGFVAGDAVNLITDTNGVDLSSFADDVTIEAAGGLVTGQLNAAGHVEFSVSGS